MGVAATVYADICNEWQEAFNSMKLTGREVEKLHSVFTNVDFNGSGSIDCAELLAFLDIERTNLSKRLFTNFDSDHNDEISFYEFVMSSWKLLALKQKSLYAYVFDLYDLNGEGWLTVKQFLHMLHELDSNFADTSSNIIFKWLAEARNKDKVTSQAFGEFCTTHQMLLHSAHDLRTRLKDRVLGAAFWDSVSDREMFVWKNEKISVSTLLDMCSDHASFNALLQAPEIQSNRALCNLLESISCARGPASPVGSLRGFPPRAPAHAKRQRRRALSAVPHTAEGTLSASRPRTPSLPAKCKYAAHSHPAPVNMFGAPLLISSSH